jgi:hypothetical protein
MLSLHAGSDYLRDYLILKLRPFSFDCIVRTNDHSTLQVEEESTSESSSINVDGKKIHDDVELDQDVEL